MGMCCIACRERVCFRAAALHIDYEPFLHVLASIYPVGMSLLRVGVRLCGSQFQLPSDINEAFGRCRK
jgi:hypothetical protein